jgi:hypothetical protein
MTEQQVVALVDRIGEVLEPDVARIVAAGTARGRSRKRRRRVVAGLGVAAAIGVVSSVSVALPRDGGSVPAAEDVAPAEVSATLAGMLPGSVIAHDPEAYVFQVPRGVVRWHDGIVTVALDSRSVGIDRTPAERCGALDGDCHETADGAWWVQHGEIEFDAIGGVQTHDWVLVKVYEPDGRVITASGERGAIDADQLREIALDDGWDALS